MTLAPESCHGIWVPVVTPFCDGALDLEALAALVRWLATTGVQGFLALGTTGEAPHLMEAEGEVVVRTVVEAAGGLPVLAGSGRASTVATQDASRRLAAAGAEGLLVLTPHVYRGRMDAEALGAHYAAVAGEVPVPVFVYHMPGATGLDLEATVLTDLVQIPNIWGFKDSSTQGGPLAETLRRVTTRGFVGSGTRVLDGLEAGACGAILAIANAIPELCVRLDAAWHSGRQEEALALQARAAAFTEALGGWGVAGIKAALAVRGRPGGELRAPLRLPPPVVRRAIESALRAATEAV